VYAYALTRDEERVLAPRARRYVNRRKGAKGRRCDREAADRMAKSVGGQVMNMANKLGGGDTHLTDDLYQEGMMTVLFKCLQKFQPELGFKFTTYACFSAQRAMWRYLEKKGKGQNELSVHFGLFDDHERGRHEHDLGTAGLSLELERKTARYDPPDR
jgi:DNA-directed RNA polymerase sigma subunit (sigma70/sigma32)